MSRIIMSSSEGECTLPPLSVSWVGWDFGPAVAGGVGSAPGLPAVKSAPRHPFWLCEFGEFVSVPLFLQLLMGIIITIPSH